MDVKGYKVVDSLEDIEEEIIIPKRKKKPGPPPNPNSLRSRKKAAAMKKEEKEEEFDLKKISKVDKKLGKLRKRILKGKIELKSLKKLKKKNSSMDDIIKVIANNSANTLNMVDSLFSMLEGLRDEM